MTNLFCSSLAVSSRVKWVGPVGAGLRQRLEITNDWVSDTGDPAEDACAQEKIEKVAPGCLWIGNRLGLVPPFQIS